MDMRDSLVIFACLTLLAGCSRPQPPDASSPSPTASASIASAQVRQIDACSLLTADEIQSVQGEAVTGTTPSGGTLNGFPSRQCVFMTVTPVNSVSVVVTQTAANSPRHVREFWNETFHRKDHPDKPGAERDGEEEERKKAPPETVPDLGDEAFWMGTQVSTALYVLKGESFLRISVGGAGDQAVKLEKSKTLAQFALNRL